MFKKYKFIQSPKVKKIMTGFENSLLKISLFFENRLLKMFLSSIIVIPIIVYTVLFLENNNTIISDMRNELVLSISEIIMYLCLIAWLLGYFYIINYKSKKIRKIFFVLIIIGVEIYVFTNSLFNKNSPKEAGIYYLLIFNAYAIAYLFISIAHLIMNSLIEKLNVMKNWVFKEEDSIKTEMVLTKLSFIGKVITGVITCIGSIIAILLTIQQLFFN